MVGRDPERRVLDGHAAKVSFPRKLLDLPDDPREQVRVVVVVLAFEDRRDALEAGARIDAGLRERSHLSRGVAVELHEDEVPDLHDTVAGAVRRRVAGHSLALVVVELAARAARSRCRPSTRSCPSRRSVRCAPSGDTAPRARRPRRPRCRPSPRDATGSRP